MCEPSSVAAAGEMFDCIVDAGVGIARRAGVEHQRLADLHLVAAGKHLLLHAAAVDEGPVGAVQVGDCVVAVGAAELDVLAGDLRVVNVQHTRLVAPEPDDRLRPTRSASLGRFRG